MTLLRIDVASQRGPYPIIVGAGSLGRLASLLREHDLGGTSVVISAAPIWRHVGGQMKRLAAGRQPLLIADGERAKSLTTVGRLYDGFVRRRLDRSAVVIAVGGGVVGDVGGFAAATFLRGLRLVHVATTLLAQVDSAVGGKVGVNLPAGKNLVGAFHPPSLVVCDPAVLTSLAAREFRSGLYEVVKYGVIRSRPLFDRLAADLDRVRRRDRRTLTDLVAACCRIKADVVGQDEREGGLRRILNFGHTIGHALEAVTKYRRFRHGEAIAYGMLAAAHLSAARGLLGADDEATLRDLVTRLGQLPPVADLRVTDALDAVRMDKKVSAGRLHFVLAGPIGVTTIVDDVTPAHLTAAMRSIGMRR